MEIDHYTYATLTPSFLDALAQDLRGKKVLEVFAGNGRMAQALAVRGVDVTATTLFASHDGHFHGMHHPVAEMEAGEAVLALGAQHDVLLASWPTADDGMARAAGLWGEEKPILFVGEFTLWRGEFQGWGGCASDLFFQGTQVVSEIPGYVRRSGLERAAFLKVREGWEGRLVEEARYGRFSTFFGPSP
jgi:hypothetical protein